MENIKRDNEVIEVLLPHILNGAKVSTDTRTIQQGDIFIALFGPSFDGNKFAATAIEKGAIKSIIDKAEAFADKENYLLVADGLALLQGLARAYRQRFNIPIIGITGSNGKTTTRDLLANVLSKKYKTHVTKGNFNNHIGLPLTLLEMPKETEVAILEMGDNKPGDIAELCDIALPTHGFVTNIGKDHLEGFGNMEGNVNTKCELYDYLESNHGRIFMPSDDALLQAKRGNYSTITAVGGEEDANKVELLKLTPFVSYVDQGGNEHDTSIFGAYNLPNIQAAVTIGKSLEVNDALLHEAIAEYVPANNRSQVKKTASNTVILDAYNANPSSVEQALINFSLIQTSEEKVVILGDMLELGDISQEEHRRIIELAQSLMFDARIFCGEEFFSMKNDFSPFFSEKSDLVSYLQANPIDNAMVLLKGSRGLAMDTLEEWL